MKLRNQYLIAGAAWALLLGPLASLGLFGLAAGISWLWLFGDDPWPEATRWALPLIALLGGTAAAAVCIIAAAVHGRRRETLTRQSSRSDRRKLLLLVAAPLALGAMVVAGLWHREREYSRSMTLATQREARFAELTSAAHRVTGLQVTRGVAGTFRANALLVGSRKGAYRLQWRVTGTSFGADLAARAQTVHLEPGERQVSIVFTLDELARSYASKVLSGSGSVLVDEKFKLEASLLPLLTEAELQALPPGKRHRLDRGDTPLRAARIAAFSVRFVAHSDGGGDR